MTPEARQLACAAQHFGPWMVEPKWFTQAVAAVKAGTFKAAAPAPESAIPDGAVTESTGDGQRVLYFRENGVARIPIAGQMVKGDSSFGGASSVRARRAVRKAVADDSVRSILLHIDSPGGTVAGTGDLAADVAAADQQKPVYTYFEDLGASAAYWVGSQARRVFANPTALIGSIGTLAVVEDTSGKMERDGVKVMVVSTGAHKGAFVDGTPVSNEQLQALRKEVTDLNEHFLAGVMSARKMTRETLAAIADGRVFIASEAMGLGLIDQVSSIDEAMQEIHMEEQIKAMQAENSKLKADLDVATARISALETPATVSQLKGAFADHPGFILEQAEKGATMAAAAVAFTALLSKANTELKQQLVAKDEQIAKLAAKGATADNGHVFIPDPTESGNGPTATDFSKIDDPAARAAAEFKANLNDCQKAFVSEAVYVAARVAALRGRVKMTKTEKK